MSFTSFRTRSRLSDHALSFPTLSLRALAIGTLLSAFAVSADAQPKKGKKVPPGHLPAAGECRVWYDGRPPGQQPAPTNCETARYEAARTGGRVLYGSDRKGKGARDRDDRDDRDNRDDRYPDRRYPDRRDSDGRYPDGRYPDGRYPDGRYPDGRYPDGRYPDGRYPDGRYPDGRYPDGRYPDGRYPTDDFPSTLPEMVWAIMANRGERPDGLRQWLGTSNVVARTGDTDRDGRPEVVIWTDPRGRTVQRWYDGSRDGRADRVEIFRDGKLARVIR